MFFFFHLPGKPILALQKATYARERSGACEAPHTALGLLEPIEDRPPSAPATPPPALSAPPGLLQAGWGAMGWASPFGMGLGFPARWPFLTDLFWVGRVALLK